VFQKVTGEMFTLFQVLLYDEIGCVSKRKMCPGISTARSAIPYKNYHSIAHTFITWRCPAKETGVCNCIVKATSV
jgi:hypothetical protein